MALHKLFNSWSDAARQAALVARKAHSASAQSDYNEKGASRLHYAHLGASKNISTYSNEKSSDAFEQSSRALHTESEYNHKRAEQKHLEAASAHYTEAKFFRDKGDNQMAGDHEFFAQRHQEWASAHHAAISNRDEPFYKLFNSGTSEGVKKAWETRKGEFGGEYHHDDAKGHLQTASTISLVHKINSGAAPSLQREARLRLAGEGLDKEGNWIGFEKANALHGFSKTDFKQVDKEIDDPHHFHGILQVMHPKTAAKIASGEIDSNRLIREELASRGMDRAGNWVGFDKAKKIHGV